MLKRFTNLQPSHDNQLLQHIFLLLAYVPPFCFAGEPERNNTAKQGALALSFQITTTLALQNELGSFSNSAGKDCDEWEYVDSSVILSPRSLIPKERFGSKLKIQHATTHEHIAVCTKDKNTSTMMTSVGNVLFPDITDQSEAAVVYYPKITDFMLQSSVSLRTWK